MVAAGFDEIRVRYGTHLVAALIIRSFGARGFRPPRSAELTAAAVVRAQTLPPPPAG